MACVNETAAVANADGATIDPTALVAELDDAHPELGSSMRRDIASGREPELDCDSRRRASRREAERHRLSDGRTADGPDRRPRRYPDAGGLSR